MALLKIKRDFFTFCNSRLEEKTQAAESLEEVRGKEKMKMFSFAIHWSHLIVQSEVSDADDASVETAGSN